MFAVAYRCLYVSLVLYIAIAEYRKGGDLIETAAFSLLMLAGLELLYWLYWMKANISEFSESYKDWFKKQQDKAARDRDYPNIPLFIAFAVAIFFIGLAALMHFIFPETCDPASGKWLFRVAICKQPFRIFFYSSTIGVFAVFAVTYLVIAYRLRRQ